LTKSSGKKRGGVRHPFRDKRKGGKKKKSVPFL